MRARGQVGEVMKRIIVVLPALAVIAGISACGATTHHTGAGRSYHATDPATSPASAPSPASTPPPPPSPAPSATLSGGQKFVAGVENDSTTYLGYQGMGVWPSDSQLISLGHTICTSVEDAGTAATVTTVDGSPNFSDLGVSAQQMMDLAQVNLCPQTITS
jgi:hypothetical protein